MNINGDSELYTDVLADIIKSRRCVERGIKKLTLYPSETQENVKRLTGKLQPLINDGFIMEVCDTTPNHWYGRLDPTVTAWCESIIDLGG